MTQHPVTSSTEAQTLMRAAQLAGCDHDAQLHSIDVNGEPRELLWVKVSDNEQAMALLRAMADLYQTHPDVVSIAQEIHEYAALTVAVPSAELIAHGVQTYVQKTVRYEEEEIERFCSPLVTLRIGLGDCDDHALLVCVLARAAGLQARIVPLRDTSGAIVHAVTQIKTGGGWMWAETTIAAGLGEHPLDAAQRLGVLRSDLGR